MILWRQDDCWMSVGMALCMDFCLIEWRVGNIVAPLHNIIFKVLTIINEAERRFFIMRAIGMRKREFVED